MVRYSLTENPHTFVRINCAESGTNRGFPENLPTAPVEYAPIPGWGEEPIVGRVVIDFSALREIGEMIRCAAHSAAVTQAMEPGCKPGKDTATMWQNINNPGIRHHESAVLRQSDVNQQRIPKMIGDAQCQ